MIFWIIAISYFTIATVIYLVVIRATKIIGDGDIVESIKYSFDIFGEDTDNLTKIKSMSLESSLWIDMLIGSIAWPFTIYYIYCYIRSIRTN